MLSSFSNADWSLVYLLWINVYSDSAYFKKIVCPFIIEDFLFTFLMVSTEAQKFLNLVVPTLLFFSFVVYAFGVIANKPKSQKPMSMFYVWSFIVLALTLTSLIHFLVKFCICYEIGADFILFHVDINLPQHCLSKTIIFPFNFFLASLSKIN